MHEGSLIPHQIALVQESFGFLASDLEALATEFYDRLFVRAPGMRPLFRNDLAEQGRKLTAMLAVAVDGLACLDMIAPTLRASGRRHVGYGVMATDYDIVGAVLIDAIGARLGDRFTIELREAWMRTFGLLAATMRAAAGGAGPERDASAG